tara:strand:+ start:237 stop:392 length:156 start_codon:yes stop_codon:yes gene_type:complete
MEDLRFDCHELCIMTHDNNNKCDGHCINYIAGVGPMPDYEERKQRAQEHEE